MPVFHSYAIDEVHSFLENLDFQETFQKHASNVAICTSQLEMILNKHICVIQENKNISYFLVIKVFRRVQSWKSAIIKKIISP